MKRTKKTFQNFNFSSFYLRKFTQYLQLTGARHHRLWQKHTNKRRFSSQLRGVVDNFLADRYQFGHRSNEIIELFK